MTNRMIGIGLVLITVFSFSALGLMSCTETPPQTHERTGFVLPDGLKDCKVYSMTDGGVMYSYITVVRCPMSQTATTYPCGKGRCSASVVEIDTAGLGEYTRLKAKFAK